MFNRVILMGRLTADPNLTQTQSGIAMCRFSVAVDRSFVKKGEERKADFFEITAWRQTAEFVAKHFCKGRMIHLEGTLQNNNYTDQNGVKHYSTAIMAEHVNFCGDRRQDVQDGSSAPQAYAQPQPQQYTPAPQPQSQAPQPQTYTQPQQYTQPQAQPQTQQYAQPQQPQYAPTPQYAQPQVQNTVPTNAPAQAPAPQPAPYAAPAPAVQTVGDLGDFEEILSDGDVPF